MGIQAEDVSASLSSDSPDPTEAIAELLISDEEKPEVDDTSEADKETDDKEEAEELTEESIKEVDESEDDPSWEAALGVDEGQLNYDEEGNIAGVNVKINDKSDTVSMKDLIGGYQNNKSFTQKSQVLAEDRKTFDTQVNNVRQEYESKLSNVESLTNFLENKLVQEFEGVDWNQLRVDNPAEYAAARQDYSARAQELKQAQDAISSEKQQQIANQNAAFQQNTHQHVKQEFTKMLDNNPAWNNPDILKKDMTELKDYCYKQYGFQQGDFDRVSDSRLIEVLKDAKAYRDGVKVADIKRKKPVPKFQKSKGKSKKPRVSKLDKLTKAASNAHGAQKRDLQTDAIAELLGG